MKTLDMVDEARSSGGRGTVGWLERPTDRGETSRVGQWSAACSLGFPRQETLGQTLRRYCLASPYNMHTNFRCPDRKGDADLPRDDWVA